MKMIIGNLQYEIQNVERGVIELKITDPVTQHDIVISHLNKAEALAFSVALKTEAMVR